MRLLKVFVWFPIFFFCVHVFYAQDKAVDSKKILRRQLISAQSGLPIPYVTIIMSGSNKKYISDNEGYFNIALDDKSDSVAFDRISLKMKKLPKSYVIDNAIIELEEHSYSLGEIAIVPDNSRATQIIQKVLSNLNRVHYNLVSDYKCIAYNKMVFDLDTLHSEVALLKTVPHTNTHLLLIESVVEKKHAAPDLNSEKIIGGRVSGFTQPSLEFIPSQIKPTDLSQRYLHILSGDYLNPITNLGIKLYQFQLADSTMGMDGAYRYKIRFYPKNRAVFKGLTGYLYVNSKSYSVVGSEIIGLQENGRRFLISQTLKIERDSIWYPNTLNATIEVGDIQDRSGQSFSLIGELKGYYTNYEVNQNYSRSDFKNVVLEQPTFYDDTTSLLLNKYRERPLSVNDSLTFNKIDSVGKRYNFDQIISLGREMAEGFIPIGLLKIDYTKLIDFNRKEGLALGLGLYTSSTFSKRVVFGGYYRYGLSDKLGKYGFSGAYTYSKENQTQSVLKVKSDVIETTSFIFLDGYPSGSSEAFKRFSISQMDRFKHASLSFESRFFEDFKGQILMSLQETESTSTVLSTDTALMGDNLKEMWFSELGLKFRWVYKETFMKTSLRNVPLPSKSPYFWVNGSTIKGRLEGRSFSAYKFEGQVEKSIFTGGGMLTSIRFSAARVIGDLPLSMHYSSFGTYNPVLSIDVANSFGTMRPHEFVADRFVLGSVRHRIPLFSNKSQRFKPILFLNTLVGFGDEKSYNAPTFNKGYFESGAVLDNLLKSVFIKYGLGVYYRYGYYHLPTEGDNFSVKLSVEFAF